ncbi:hypothetical protein QJQ45_008414 [Haematococcus lacustris]|nr:hypothetical protein QJQ45_008414 [Haematococcus lacustris]
MLFSMAKKKRRTVPRPVPEDPDSDIEDRDEALQPDLTEAQQNRKVALVNLDPANDVLPYTPDVDIMDLVDLTNVMAELHLGPNGALVYAMDHLLHNMDWLRSALAPFEKGAAKAKPDSPQPSPAQPSPAQPSLSYHVQHPEGAYVLFDLPGQVELFMMHDSLRVILTTITNTWHYRLAVAHLVDAHLCTDANKFISCLLLSLSTMLHLELPHINVLSKVDLLRQYGQLGRCTATLLTHLAGSAVVTGQGDFSLDFYTEVHDLQYLVRALGDSPFNARYRKLSAALCEVVQDFGMVSFVPLVIQDKKSAAHVLALLDKANGYVYASLGTQSPYPAAAVFEGSNTDLWETYQEQYIDKGPSRTDLDMSASGTPDIVEREVAGAS